MSEDFLVLTFEGQHTIEKALSVRESLLQAIEGEKNKILIDLSRLKKIDLSFLQLLYSAGLEAEANGKEISLTGEVPQQVKEAVFLAGFDKNLDKKGAILFSQIIGNEG